MKEGVGVREKGTWGAERKRTVRRTHSRKLLYTTVIELFPPARPDSLVQGSGFTV